jgi:hypothetical protein
VNLFRFQTSGLLRRLFFVLRQKTSGILKT